MRIFLACTSSACNKEDKDTFYKENKPLYVLETFFSGEKSCKDALNIIGCVLFVIYGIGINSISIWLTNGVLGIIHIYKIRNIKRR